MPGALNIVRVNGTMKRKASDDALFLNKSKFNPLSVRESMQFELMTQGEMEDEESKELKAYGSNNVGSYSS